MIIITDLNQVNQIKEPIAAALGYFDGLHLGHQSIIRHTNVPGMKRGIITFKNQPASYIAHTHKPYRLISLEDKIGMMEEMGTDYLFLYEFTDEVRNISKEDFIERFLYRCNVKHAVAGFNFSFGRNKEGDTAFLLSECRRLGIATEIIAPVTYDGDVISSTLIRNKLYKGDVVSAAKMLSRPFYLKGTVTEGKKLGRQFGFPTANIHVDEEIIVPKWGVYRTDVIIEGEKYKSITNVGNNPTIQGDPLRVETHLLDVDLELYGQTIKIEFIERIRDEIKFDSLDALRAQVLNDIQCVRNS